MMICIHVAQGSLPLSLKTPGVEPSSVVREVTDRYRQDHFNQHVQIGSNPPRLCGPGCAAQEVGHPRSVRTGLGMPTTFDHIPPSWRSNSPRICLCACSSVFTASHRLPYPPPPLPPPPLSPSLLHPGTRRRRGGDPDICRQVFGVFTMAAMIGLALPRGAGSAALGLNVTRGRLAFEKGCCWGCIIHTPRNRFWSALRV